MTQENRFYWFVIAAALLLWAGFLFFDAGEPPAPRGGVTLRMSAASPALPQQEIAAPRNEREEIRQLIDSGQLAPPPGNPDKMYSIASPFAAAAPAATPATAPGGPSLALLGARPAGPAPARPAGENAPAPAVASSIPPQAPTQPGEFETPPGVGSAKGGR